MDNLVPASKVCQKYNISRRTLNYWLNDGLPCYRLGYRLLRFDMEAVNGWIRQNNK
ncbi:helix-turn-helix transcriptional regulator [Paenibacillus rhizophilus]|uniref:helix-turn-helix transcriptional regulator n=1 Tax=Paenibacillus rhizophilus TaxID=1850366 RepID=UPI000F5BC9AC